MAFGFVVCSGNKSDFQRGMKAIDTIRTELRKSHIRALFDGSRTYDILVPTRDRDKAKGIVLKLIIKDKLPAKLYKD